MKHLSVLGLVALIQVAFLVPARAVISTWQGTTSLWSASANWTGGVPVEGVNAVFYAPSTTAFTISTSGASRVAGGLEFLGSDANSITIGLGGDGSTSARSLRLYSGSSPSAGDIVVDSGASGTFSIIASDTTGPRQLVWGPTSGTAAAVENHSILNNSTSATLLIGVEQNENTTTTASALNLTYGGVGNINVTAAINVSSASQRTVNLIKQDAGTLTLSSTNGYNGSTTINGGTLQLGNGGTTGSIVGTGTVTDNSGGTLAFDRSDSSTFANTITGSGALAQIGSGTTILSGANTYTGTTTVSAGTLQVGNGGTLGSIVGDVAMQNNSTLIFARSSAAGTITYGGVISGSTGLVEKLNSGTLILTGASTFSGTTMMVSTTGNNIRLANTNALQNSTVSVSVTNGLQFDTGTNSYTIGALTGGSNFALQDTGGGAVTLRAGNNNASTAYSGTMSGIGGLTKIGTGALILSNTSTYTGATIVSNGSLLIRGNLGATDVTVAGSTNLAAGHAAGGSFKTINVASLTAGSAGLESKISLDLGAAGSTDAIAATGAINLTNSQQLNLVLTDTTLSGGVSSLNGAYILLSWTGGNLTSLSQIDLAGSSSDFDISDFAITGNTLTFTATPEPSTWALLGIGLAMGQVWSWRKRRRQENA